MSVIGERMLWCEVLLLAVTDAIEGLRGHRAPKKTKIKQIVAARRFITVPNRDFNELCELAGVNPDAVRERVVALIEAAPTPEELVARKGKPTNNRRTTRTRKTTRPRTRKSASAPGVVLDFVSDTGTGAGRSAQETPEISFPDRKRAS